MKAVTCRRYGGPDVIEVEEVSKPVPGDRELLVKIRATPVESSDDRVRGAKFPALFWLPMRLALGFGGPRKKILGASFAGTVEAVGKDVTRFREGDRVFGTTGFAFGCHAEYACLPEDAVTATLPDSMACEEAATLPFGGNTALHFLRRGRLGPGRKILIYGASGSLGSFAVQLAKAFGAEVTGVCSTANLDLVRSLGADEVIDYTREDFSRRGESYDVIFDTVGQSGFSRCVRSLKGSGIYLRAVHLDLLSILRGLWTSWTSGKKVVGGVARQTTENLVCLRDLVESGKLRPVIQKKFPLEEAAQAHRLVHGGHKKGCAVLSLA